MQLEAKDVAAIGGIAINLIFNTVNYFRTSKVRSETLRLDEFKRLRGPVDAALTAIKGHRSTLRSLEASGSSAIKVTKAIADCNKALSESYNSLCDALSDLDRSRFVQGKDWSSVASEAWEEIGEAFDRAYVRGKDIVGLKDAIRKIIAKIDNLLQAINKRLDSQII
jgi:hypothetical protein